MAMVMYWRPFPQKLSDVFGMLPSNVNQTLNMMSRLIFEKRKSDIEVGERPFSKENL